ncbi:glycosyltransferase [Tenacibaculum amylolyticum]|uniref:glycosyltransferase n=1 Tax=Tenacibaculum amylolyticum TaxID=104269 RepID=UPI0038936789
MEHNKKHILFLCGWYPSRVLPNNGDFIQRHAEAVSLLHQVSVIHIISDINATRSIEVDSKIVNGIHTHIAYVKPTKNNLVKFQRFYKAFFLLLKKVTHFDVVHLNKLFPFGLFALYLKWFLKKEYIISEHWTGYHSPQVQKISKIEVFLSKHIAKNAKYVCPVSVDLENSMKKLGLKGAFVRVPNVVDTKLFASKKHQTKTPYTILHVSNMQDHHKNVSGIINTIARFKEYTTDFSLVLIGENSKKYKKLAAQLNVVNFIKFIEHIPHQEVVNYMQEASVFVLFSNFENLPCVILESFSCGTPVISTNVGGVNEFFPNNFGYLITPKDEEALLIKLQAIHKTYVSAEKLHTYAVTHFSKEVIAKQFSNLYLSN